MHVANQLFDYAVLVTVLTCFSGCLYHEDGHWVWDPFNSSEEHERERAELLAKREAERQKAEREDFQKRSGWSPDTPDRWTTTSRGPTEVPKPSKPDPDFQDVMNLAKAQKEADAYKRMSWEERDKLRKKL